MAWLALLVAVLAAGLAAWGLVRGAGEDCQAAAWDTAPAAADLPEGWRVGATQYDLGRKTMSFLGPEPADPSFGQPVVYATVTCFERGAAESVTRSAEAAGAAGQAVTDRPDLGDGGFSASDDTGATFVQLRRGPVVVYLAGSGDTLPQAVDALASAFDRSLGGGGGTALVGTPVPSGSPDALPSLDPAIPPGPDPSPGDESPAAPELEARLPSRVGELALAVDSATGSMILGEDQGSRAILAALRDEGMEADALQVAQAYDELGESDLSILALSVEGMAPEKVRDLVLDSWLAASGAGVTRDTVTLAGAAWDRVDYGDGGTVDYVLGDGSTVFVVTTGDPELAEEAAAAID